MSDVEETIAVPKKATEAMTKAGAEFAMQADLSSDYPWPVYISDLWAVMVANAPAPKPDSPVCVETVTLAKVRNLRDRLQGFTPGSWEASLCITANEIEAELVNARSVESVKAECADQIASLAAGAERCGLTDKAEHFRVAEREVRYGARSLTEGEG